jgi:hypothetical protein
VVPQGRQRLPCGLLRGKGHTDTAMST